MTRSSHERHREILSALAGDALVLPLVREAGERLRWWTTEREWRRTYGRFTLAGGTLVTLVYMSETPSQEICRIDLSDRRSNERTSSKHACDIRTSVGWVRVMRFPFDPALTGLAPAAAVGTVVRYHPGKRCTFRAAMGSRPVFAKVYASPAGAGTYHALGILYRSRTAGDLRMAIAEPLAWDAETRTLWQAALPGEAATDRLSGASGDDLAQRMGIAAASLTRASVIPTAVFDGAAALARSRRHGAELLRRVPELSAIVKAIIDRLAAAHARFPTHERTCIHGAPHPDQWLDAGSELGLVDFDRLASGDPEADAGVVLGDFDALREPAVAPERLAAAFLSGYRAAGIALREPLVLAYRVHHLLGKALRAAQHIRPDGDRRAARVVERAAKMSKEAVLS